MIEILNIAFDFKNSLSPRNLIPKFPKKNIKNPIPSNQMTRFQFDSYI